MNSYSLALFFHIVGALGFFMVWRFVHEPEDLKAIARKEAEKQRKHMDWAGIALLWTGLNTLAVEAAPQNRGGAVSFIGAWKFAGNAAAPAGTSL